MRYVTKEGYEVDSDKILRPGQKIKLNINNYFGNVGSYGEGVCLGWLVGDGSIKPGVAVLGFDKRSNGKDYELVPMFERLLMDIYKQDNKVYDLIPNNQETTVLLNSAVLKRVANRHGITCKEDKLKVPEGDISKEMARGFLKGLFSADGSVSVLYTEDGNLDEFSVHLVSISRNLLRQVQDLLLKFNIYSFVFDLHDEHYTTFPNGRTSLCKKSYKLSIRGIDCFMFYNEIGFLQNYQQEKLILGMNSYKKKPKTREFVGTVKEVS